MQAESGLKFPVLDPRGIDQQTRASPGWTPNNLLSEAFVEHEVPQPTRAGHALGSLVVLYATGKISELSLKSSWEHC